MTGGKQSSMNQDVPCRTGLVVLDKPEGMTSRRAVDRVSRLVKPLKAGHAGTLDPLATGVLVVAVGGATRLVPRIQQMPKSYRAVFRLGWTSPTDDAESELVETVGASLPEEGRVREALGRFVGRVQQLPPDFSAVHVGGQRAYKLARRGQAVELAAKPVEIHRCELAETGVSDIGEITVDIECGSGTYIRSIGRDLGEELGCGAVMMELTRTAIGPFTLDNAVAPEELTRDRLGRVRLPATVAIPEVPQVQLTASESLQIAHGRRIPLPAAEPRAARLVAELTGDEESAGQSAAAIIPEVAAVAADGELAALAAWDDSRQELVPKQVLVRPEHCQL